MVSKRRKDRPGGEDEVGLDPPPEFLRRLRPAPICQSSRKKALSRRRDDEERLARSEIGSILTTVAAVWEQSNAGSRKWRLVEKRVKKTIVDDAVLRDIGTVQRAHSSSSRQFLQ